MHGCMRLVGTLFAMEVCFRVATTAIRRRFVRTVLRLEALHPRPGFDQRAIDREMVCGQQPLYLGPGKDCTQELRSDVTSKQSVAVLRKHRMVPGGIVNAGVDEPAEEKVVFQPSEVAQNGSNRRLAEAWREEAFLAQSTAARSVNKALQNLVPIKRALRSRPAGWPVEDDLFEHEPPDPHS